MATTPPAYFLNKPPIDIPRSTAQQNPQHPHASDFYTFPHRTLSLREYRKQQRTPSPVQTVSGERRLKRRPATPNFHAQERVPLRESDESRSPSREDFGHSPPSYHQRHHFHQHSSSGNDLSSILGDYETHKPCQSLLSRKDSFSLSSFIPSPEKSLSLRSASLSQRAPTPSASPFYDDLESLYRSYGSPCRPETPLNPSKRLPRPQGIRTVSSGKSSIKSAEYTSPRSFRVPSSADSHDISTISLSRFPQPPIKTRKRKHNSVQPPPPFSHVSVAAPTITPPATPTVLHYRGASFDLLNPHPSLDLENVVTPIEPEAEWGQRFYLDRSESAEKLMASEDKDPNVGRKRYSTLGTAHLAITGQPFAKVTGRVEEPKAQEENASSLPMEGHTPRVAFMPSRAEETSRAGATSRAGYTSVLDFYGGPNHPAPVPPVSPRSAPALQMPSASDENSSGPTFTSYGDTSKLLGYGSSKIPRRKSNIWRTDSIKASKDRLLDPNSAMGVPEDSKTWETIRSADASLAEAARTYKRTSGSSCANVSTTSDYTEDNESFLQGTPQPSYKPQDMSFAYGASNDFAPCGNNQPALFYPPFSQPLLQAGPNPFVDRMSNSRVGQGDAQAFREGTLISLASSSPRTPATPSTIRARGFSNGDGRDSRMSHYTPEFLRMNDRGLLSRASDFMQSLNGGPGPEIVDENFPMKDLQRRYSRQQISKNPYSIQREDRVRSTLSIKPVPAVRDSRQPRLDSPMYPISPVASAHVRTSRTGTARALLSPKVPTVGDDNAPPRLYSDHHRAAFKHTRNFHAERDGTGEAPNIWGFPRYQLKDPYVTVEKRNVVLFCAITSFPPVFFLMVPFGYAEKFVSFMTNGKVTHISSENKRFQLKWGIALLVFYTLVIVATIAACVSKIKHQNRELM